MGLRAKLDELEQRKVVLEARRATMTPPPPRLHPDPAIQSEALQISRGLSERVVLHPMDMGIEIELIVEIAAMVDLGTNNKTAGLKGSAVCDPYRRLLDMAAGERNQRYLQGLVSRIPVFSHPPNAMTVDQIP